MLGWQLCQICYPLEIKLLLLLLLKNLTRSMQEVNRVVINNIVFSPLMEIKGFSQCIAANKQQWCGLVPAASCRIVAAYEFFICKLVLLLLVAATLRL